MSTDPPFPVPRMDDTSELPKKAKKRNRWLLFTVLGVLIAVLAAASGIVAWYGKSGSPD